MSDAKPKKDASTVLVKEREKTLATSIRKRASTVHFLDRAFEEAGCSCTPLRAHLKDLESEYQAEKERLIQELNHSSLAIEMAELRKTILETDVREHPLLDRDARQAYPFLAVWMIGQVREGKPDILALSNEEISRSFAEAWYCGWRPKSLYKTNND